MTRHRLAAIMFATLGAFAVASCGGDDDPGTGPSGGGGGGGTVAATITITSTGASPRNVTVAVGSRVTFTNNDTRPHDMDSDPHPDHTDCPALNVGFIQPGQSATTQNLNSARRCGFHDHNQPSETSLQGAITVQ
jgi:plastocyanin